MTCILRTYPSAYAPSPKPEKSTILFELIDEDTCQWTRWDKEQERHVEVGRMIGELQHEGGSAELEAYSGMLDVAIYEMLDDEEHTEGWWVMEGFYATYYRGDGWETDDDVDYDFDHIRPARWSDIAHFGVMRVPLWARVLGWLGLDLRV